MPDRVGKYHILGQIGRGGMGTILKARDPILDRSVAVKVMSGEVEITDELRSRFFREARACARLNHPNIVTVHDMGEDEGLLYIVMELLEGEDLRRLIAQDRRPALEDQLAIMVQVCDGLQFAHQNGIVHRDIKPANIFLLRNGQVKILDFGIAQIETPEGRLTRTGLIMGTLRYMSPEQLRGHADARSDMFSAGAMFYELMSRRPPFTGENPVALLEQIRTEEPPPLDQLDPGIPSELAAIVRHAMQKDPVDRFSDLAEMRAELEQVQRDVADQGRQVRARIRSRREELSRLQATLAELSGRPSDPMPVPALDERGSLAALQGLDRDLAARIELVRAKVAEAESVAARLQRGTDLLHAGRFTEAVTELERVVAEMPEHARAAGVLGQARAEAGRREQRAADLVLQARRALDGNGYALCLALLKQATDVQPPAEIARAIAVLRDTAERELAAHGSSRRAQQHAERAREQMMQARRSAEAWNASEYAPVPWADAVARAAGAEDLFTRHAYVEAGEAFDRAAALYRQSAARVHEAVGAVEAAHPPKEPADGAPRVVEPAVPAAGCPVVAEHSRIPMEEEGSTATTRRARDRSVHEAGRAWVLNPRVLTVAAMGGLAAIVLAMVYWLPQAPSPVPAPTRLKGDDGAEMVLVPAGELRMGSDAAEVARVKAACKWRYSYSDEACNNFFDHEVPDHSVVLNGFYLDQFEVTNSLFERFVSGTGYRTTAEELGYGWVWQRKDRWQAIRVDGAEWRTPKGPGSSSDGSHPVVQVSLARCPRLLRLGGQAATHRSRVGESRSRH